MANCYLLPGFPAFFGGGMVISIVVHLAEG